jgi:hypothetical protein
MARAWPVRSSSSTNAIQVHPLALLDYERLDDPVLKVDIDRLTVGYTYKAQFFVDRLAQGVAMIAMTFYPKEVIVRLSDFKSNEYADLLGGRRYEPTEENPMLGFRGASRYYDPRYRDGFALECQAMRKVRDEMGLTNVKLMILFCCTDGDSGAVLRIIALGGRFIGRTPVNGDLLRHAVAADRLRQEPLGRLLVTFLCEEKVDRLARFIDGAIEIAPLALDLDVGFVHPPTDPHQALMPVQRLFQQRTILDGPPVDGGVIDVNPTFFHEFLDVAGAQRVRHIPANPHENDLFGEMGTLKTDRHRLSPSCITVGHSMHHRWS